MPVKTISQSFLVLALVLGLSGAVLLTELGQLLNLPRDWVFGYFRHKEVISALMLSCAVPVVVLQLRHALFGKWSMRLFVIVILGSLFIVNWFVPYYWLRSEQHGAEFISISEADTLLNDSEDVLVLEIAGDARAYPREWMQLPHFAGHTVGGQEVVMSYCALSDLPQAFSTSVNGQEADYRVIAQVHNNLIFTDTETGELYQQMTGRGEYSGATPQSYPVQRMPWGSFKALYPDGQVFYTKPNIFDQFTQLIFDAGLKAHYAGQPLFPTLTMDDDRLPSGEPIWGMQANGDAVAVAQSAFAETTQLPLQLDGRAVVAVWYPEYNMMGAFYAPADLAELGDIDAYGMSALGLLERVKLYPGVRWMVWSHWFPDSRVFN